MKHKYWAVGRVALQSMWALFLVWHAIVLLSVGKGRLVFVSVMRRYSSGGVWTFFEGFWLMCMFALVVWSFVRIVRNRDAERSYFAGWSWSFFRRVTGWLSFVFLCFHLAETWVRRAFFGEFWIVIYDRLGDSLGVPWRFACYVFGITAVFAYTATVLSGIADISSGLRLSNAAREESSSGGAQKAVTVMTMEQRSRIVLAILLCSVLWVIYLHVFGLLAVGAGIF